MNKKIILVLTLTGENKKYLLLRKTNNQACQIICFFVVNKYNFHYLKQLLIKPFS